ncbi:hypothetical protein GALMADRAFT_1328675 [Galerina marginata CBS 339.88]|uniref:CHAT domain-containing protein n=1 Tax=Galerina marginata (strain CBS 339.88) TaxID=685588 RepID=A0A067T0L0_GALM3|nr:hypothetical protein GALMADRAFT_1328675 [Galerina marginata CBS 339.88]
MNSAARTQAIFNLRHVQEFVHRFDDMGNVEDITQAIEHMESVVSSVITPYIYSDGTLSGILGGLYARRFEHSANVQDIDSAISNHQKAVESTPSGHADLPGLFNNLGNSYLCRFERTGDLKDIHSAISHHQNAVESTPSGYADLPALFNNLGNSYLRRFVRAGDLKDIHSAISHRQKAVESTPSGHADLRSWFNNLGNSYSCRFERTGDLNDINSAISHHQNAVESTPSGHADLPGLFNNLGNSYLRRFKHTGDLKDINSAISHHQKAVESTPSGHADLPMQFSNLGNSYLRRFEHTGDLKDINSAISHHQQAVESTPSGHADLPTRFKNLGNSYLRRFEHSQYFPDIEYSITSYRRGAVSNGAPSIRLKSAQHAAWHSSIHDYSHCLIDFSLAITLLSEVAGLEQTVHRRHANLLDHSDFLGLAVGVAFLLERPDAALEWLEQGRCLVWNQINQLRTPVDSLRMNYPSLADRFIEVAKALEFHGTRSSPSSSGTLAEEIHIQDDTLIHTGLAADYRKLIEEIQSLPDFDNFLRPPKVVKLLSSLPSDGPVIIFNIHKARCDALALIAGLNEPLHIPLENFSLAKAEELRKSLQGNLPEQREMEDQDRMPKRVRLFPSSMSFVLKELWDKVVQPILEALGYYFHPKLSARRRIWWCPTGPLAFLPLHAAGIYGPSYKPGLCISDFVVSSYTPTVQALNKSVLSSSASTKSTNLLLISPNTPDLSPIPFTQKEIHDLKEIVGKHHIPAVLLEDDAATVERVKEEMNACSWVHFACHGVQNAGDPLESAIHLHKGCITLLDIMSQKIPNPELAFLSACQTSKGDLKLSEEVVHLAAGMLAAGYRGVVGTMWSISDQHGPEFAKWFYEYLLEDIGPNGLDSTRAAYALDYATRKVRETLGEGDDAFLKWVPYVHFGY